MWQYKIMVLFFLLLGICTFDYSYAKERSYPLKNKVIYIDPGHGGSDPGAMYREIEEKVINLDISKQLRTKLQELGATVYLTREDDYDLSVPHTINHKRSDLSRRGNIINKSECDLFLSIHLNADPANSMKGAQVFYHSRNKENEKIAKIFQELFHEQLYSKREYKRANDLYLLNRIERPGVLLELGFLSNSSERYLLQTKDYQHKLVNVITDGVLQYLQS